MQQTSVPTDPGFVVEWQLAGDEVEHVIDLSAAESQVLLPDLATAPPPDRMSTPR